jgi:hypothetical protein
MVPKKKINDTSKLDQNLQYLKLSFIAQKYEELNKQAVKNLWSHIHYLDCQCAP